MPQYELSLRDYIRIVRKRKLVMVLSFLIFAGFAAFYASKKPPVYEAVTTVKIEERKRLAGLLTEWIVYSPGDAMETQTKVIKGFPLIKEVALRMNKITLDTLDPRVHEVVGMLKAIISAERVAHTNIIRITAIAGEPKEAMDLANTVAQVYRDENLREKTMQAKTVREFIERHLAALETKLTNAEDELKTFGQEVENINIAEEIQKRLMQLQLELASLLQKYTEKHPKVVRIREQVEQIEKQLEGLSGSQLEYSRLEREVEANKKIYTMLKEELAKVRIREAEEVADVSIVDPAVLPKSPTGYKLRSNVVLGGFLGLVVGMVLAFVAENLDTSLGTIEDVESVVKLPALGVVPSIPFDRDKGKRGFWSRKTNRKQEGYARLIAHYKPTSPVAELFRNIKTSIKLSPSRKTILVTSAGPEEGKTTILTNLGLVCAQDGLRVLLISTDLRRPAVAESFGLNKKPGLSDIITGTATLEESLKNSSDMMLSSMAIEEILKHPGLERMWILPSGPSPLNPSEVLDTKELDDLLERLRKDFDVIFLDSPPVLPVTDATILATKVDAVVLCYEIGKTSRQALVRAKSQLESAKANILGIILNHIKSEAQIGESYPYYRYKYYGRKKEEDTSNKK